MQEIAETKTGILKTQNQWTFTNGNKLLTHTRA